MNETAVLKAEEPPSSTICLNERRGGDDRGLSGINAAVKLSSFADAGLFKDWRWQMSNRLKSLEELRLLLRLKPHEAESYGRLIKQYRFSATPYYLSLIDWSNPDDPVRKQCIPDLKELDCGVVGDEDPLHEEGDTAVPGVVHRYPDRVLAVVTNTCSMYCRHCTRKRIWRDGETSVSRKDLSRMLSYIRTRAVVREVVVSGGDPLTMNIDLLDWFLGEIRKIPHIEVVRIGTRVPVVMPMRITDELAGMLKAHRPLWLNTQFNHPREVTREAAEACDRILCAGIPVSNQSVLLKGVNDSVDVMKDLCHRLQRIMVRPYYLFECDPVVGAGHFRTSVWKGIEIIEGLRGHTGGLSIPTFVVDAPNGGGKIPLQPFYLMSISDREVVLRNYEGRLFKYYNPAESEDVKPKKHKGNGGLKGKVAACSRFSGGRTYPGRDINGAI